MRKQQRWARCVTVIGKKKRGWMNTDTGDILPENSFKVPKSVEEIVITWEE